MNKLEEPGRNLIWREDKLPPISLEKNRLGFCSVCDGEIWSLAYHRHEGCWLVSASCSKDHLVLMRYGEDWSWKEDLELEIASQVQSISSLDKEKLSAVFTPAEIRTMEACERSEPYTRQNLYRARAKYDRFEKLFGIRLKL